MNDYSQARSASSPIEPVGAVRPVEPVSPVAAGAHDAVTAEHVAAWLAFETDVAASGDAGFADDGELPGPPLAGKPLKPAAVLILLVDRGDAAGPGVLFTQRTAHLTDHAGQISFPGGRVEEHDRDTTHTALRETEEETGVPAHRVQVLGTIPDYSTGTGYIVTPIVGWIDAPLEYKPDPTEVAECFEVPFQFLIDEANHRLESAMYKGRMRSYYAIPFRERYIWGATAGMLITLTRVVTRARGGVARASVRMAVDSGG
jgi:8-oxo-dGTP pyrophosphatase MutT (NUDIX family)